MTTGIVGEVSDRSNWLCTNADTVQFKTMTDISSSIAGGR
jgi:hypothetical protein